MYVRESAGIFYYLFRAEGNWVAYIPSIPTEIESKILDFFGQLDILVAPFSKSEQKFLEQIEPKMLISFAPNAPDLISALGDAIAHSTSYKLKTQDISSEKTSLVILNK